MLKPSTTNIRHLEVILKVSERCNIDCTYCYFFYGGDESYKKHPPLISSKKIDELCVFLNDAIVNLGFNRIQIDFHGGEPLMMGHRRMRKACEILTESLSEQCELIFAIQTNAMLIDAEWCNLFCDYSFHVGVSLDGRKADNDRFRVDHKGNGTYDRAVAGLALVQERAKLSLLPNPTLLSVASIEVDAIETFMHFVKDLGVKRLDFLLPDYTHETVDSELADQFGDWYIALFDEWLALNDPSISIRFLRSLATLLVGGQSLMVGTGRSPFFAITIGSNGGVYPDDTLRSCGGDVFESGFGIENNSLQDFLESEKHRTLMEETSQLPLDCLGCEWSKVCGGGDAVNRWSITERFAKPTVYCGMMKKLLPHMKTAIGRELEHNG